MPPTRAVAYCCVSQPSGYHDLLYSCSFLFSLSTPNGIISQRARSQFDNQPERFIVEIASQIWYVLQFSANDNLVFVEFISWHTFCYVLLPGSMCP